MDPFATLGIAHSFEVDLGAVERTHRELSRALHPDKFVGGSPAERRMALSKAMEVNEAWRIVRDVIPRAEALLRLRGIEAGEAHRSSLPPEFLMEMLERREALADAKLARDVGEIREMADRVGEEAADAERALAEGFARDEAGQVLLAKLGELRFYRRFLDEVSAIEDELSAPNGTA